MKYRPEIDGLRALAVIPVILFHAGFEIFSGNLLSYHLETQFFYQEKKYLSLIC